VEALPFLDKMGLNDSQLEFGKILQGLSFPPETAMILVQFLTDKSGMIFGEAKCQCCDMTFYGVKLKVRWSFYCQNDNCREAQADILRWDKDEGEVDLDYLYDQDSARDYMDYPERFLGPLCDYSEYD